MTDNYYKDRDIQLGETKEGKKIVAYILPNTMLYGIKLVSGGKVPVELQGSFTTLIDAQRSVNAYLAVKNKDAKS